MGDRLGRREIAPDSVGQVSIYNEEAELLDEAMTEAFNRGVAGSKEWREGEGGICIEITYYVTPLGGLVITADSSMRG